MKILKLMSAAVMLLASVSLASANQTTYSYPNYLYLTGSTAYRSVVDKAIIAQLGGQGTCTYGSDGTIGGEHSSIFYGTDSSSNVWVVKCCWTGSEAGIQTVAGSNSVGFPPDAYVSSLTTAGITTVANVTGATAQVGTGTSTSDNDFHLADCNMSDTWQAASEFKGTYKSKTYAALTEYSGGPVGINVFKFFANKGCPSSLTGITSQLVRELWTAGYMPLSLFTGNTIDEQSSVYCIGRNPDSGTRVTTMVESGLGTSLTSVLQYATSTDGATAAGTFPITGTIQLIEYPAGTVNGISEAQGNNGYSSGGNLAKSLNSDLTNGGAGIVTADSSNTYNTTAEIASGTNLLALIGYASSNDGDGQLPHSVNPNDAASTGIVELAYNGVKLGYQSDYNTATALTEGNYTYWSYEHLYHLSGLSGNKLTLTNAIGAALPSTSGAVRISSMKVSRAIDGGVIGTTGSPF